MKFSYTVSEPINSALWRAVFMEFTMMTLFVYIGTGAVVSTGEFLRADGASSWESQSTVSRITPIAFAFGMAIMVLVYGGGHISGGHINPAVTFCLTLVDKCTVVRGCLYFVAQLLGAFLGSLLLFASVNTLKGSSTSFEGGVSTGDKVGIPPFNLGVNGLNPNLSAGNGFVFEMMGTFLLCHTVLMTAVHGGALAGGQPSNAPIAIGFAVFLAHIVLIPYTGCGINPARTFGPALVNSAAGVDSDIAWSGDAFWIYWIGPLTGAALAALNYRGLYEWDADVTPETPDIEEKQPAAEPKGVSTA